MCWDVIGKNSQELVAGTTGKESIQAKCDKQIIEHELLYRNIEAVVGTEEIGGKEALDQNKMLYDALATQRQNIIPQVSNRH